MAAEQAQPISKATAPAVAEPVLVVHSLARSFGTHEVVRSLDLTLTRGERIALRGPDGSGKTVNRLGESVF